MSSRNCTGPRLFVDSPSIHGNPVGIVANNGVLFRESALKAAHFIELCGTRGVTDSVHPEHHRIYGWKSL